MTAVVGMDKALPERVYKVSLVGSATAAVVLAVAGAWPATWGFLTGAAIGIGFFRLFWWTVDRALSRSGGKALWFALKVYVVKFPLLGLLLYYLFRRVELSPLALVGGVATVPAVMLALAIRGGLGVARSRMARAKAPGDRRSFQG